VSFAEFEESIASVALKNLAHHWNEARGIRTMPAWCDIKPGKITNVLPIIWAYTYDVQNDAFTGRVAGDRIVETFGKSFRGVPLVAIQPPEAFPWVQRLLRRVVVESRAYRGTGRVFQQLERSGRGERIILPLGGTQGDGVLGATDYHRSDFVPGVSAGPVGESETWFSLTTSNC
jgi:hypothetical protein